MRLEWLNKVGNTSLIVFFSGWSCSSDIVSHLEYEAYDVLHINDYRDIKPINNLSNYSQHYLIAWSFGVASSEHWQTHCTNNMAIDFKKKIAINGSRYPVNRTLGIPPNIMQLTINTLSGKSLNKFHQRCEINSSVDPDISALKTELEIIQSREPIALEDWDTAIIGEQDKIFPTQNTLRAWQNTTSNKAKSINTILIPSAHNPFDSWSTWSEIINL